MKPLIPPDFEKNANESSGGRSQHIPRVAFFVQQAIYWERRKRLLCERKLSSVELSCVKELKMKHSGDALIFLLMVRRQIII